MGIPQAAVSSIQDEQHVGMPIQELRDDEKSVKPTKEADAALSFALGETIAYDEDDNKRIRRSIDRHLIPWMFLTFTVQYFDKTLLSYSSVMGIIQDTNITSSEYAW